MKKSRLKMHEKISLLSTHDLQRLVEIVKARLEDGTCRPFDTNKKQLAEAELRNR